MIAFFMRIFSKPLTVIDNALLIKLLRNSSDSVHDMYPLDVRDTDLLQKKSAEN